MGRPAAQDARTRAPGDEKEFSPAQIGYFQSLF
jgi:hypothetical protein